MNKPTTRKFGRALLQDVAPYTPGEQPKDPNVIKLNTNENPYPPSPRVLEAIAALGPDRLRKYPDPLSVQLRTLCAQRYGLPGPEWIMVGNGMDELLAMAIRAFTDPGDTILSVDPTYSLYTTLAKLHGATFRDVPLAPDYQLPDALFNATGRLCFLPRPNAPSGVAAPRGDVERFCRGFNGIVVLDEAYTDFADDNCMDFPLRFDNVIVMRTFSKSFSLAGLRIGTAAARPELIHEFLRTKDSYNLNAVSQAAAIAAMQDYEYMLENVRRIRATRTRLIAALRDRNFRVPESHTNFVLAICPDTQSAPDILEHLRDRNILVRYFNLPGLQNALRISIGTDQETDALLAALDAR